MRPMTGETRETLTRRVFEILRDEILPVGGEFTPTSDLIAAGHISAGNIVVNLFSGLMAVDGESARDEVRKGCFDFGY